MKINNSDLTKELIEGAKLSSAIGTIPSEMQTTVVPVMEVNPRLLRKCNIIRSSILTTNANGTLLTASTTQQTFITSCSVAFIKDIVCDMSSGLGPGIDLVQGGATVRLCYFPIITLTAQNDSMTMSFDPPILIDKGSAVTANRGSAFTAGVCVRAMTITGYVVDPRD